eukprot:713433-Rhodomonas_salina.2
MPVLILPDAVSAPIAPSVDAVEHLLVWHAATQTPHVSTSHRTNCEQLTPAEQGAYHAPRSLAPPSLSTSAGPTACHAMNPWARLLRPARCRRRESQHRLHARHARLH